MLPSALGNISFTKPLFPIGSETTPSNGTANSAPLPPMDREKALDVLLKHQGDIDAVSSPQKKADGNYNLRDLQNLAKSPDASPELKAAATFVAKDQGLMRDIDGDLTKTKEASPYSDGNFSWNDLKKTAQHVKDAVYKFTGYDNKTTLRDSEIDVISAQSKEGNCFMLASAKAVSTTDEGKEIIKNSIKTYDNGTYGVTFAGDKDKQEYVVKPDTKFGGGDGEMLALNAAADQFYKEHGRPDGITKGGKEVEATELLTGAKMQTMGTGSSPQQIEAKLRELAPGIGKDQAVTLTGHVGKDGNMSWDGSGHAASISDINVKTGMVTYKNPWDTSQDHTVKIQDLAQQLSQPKGGQMQFLALSKS